MDFTRDQLELIRKRLRERKATTACTVCGHSDWIVSGIHMMSIGDTPGGLVLGGASLPLISLTCKNCGNTLLMNLKVLELERELVKTAEGGTTNG